MGDFNSAVAFELIREGGYSNHPNDRGGKTQYGITTATFNDAKSQGVISSSLNSVRDLTLQDAKNIYRTMYWDKINGDALPPDLSVVVFDIAVNSGVTASVKMLQGILGISQDGIIGSETLSAIANYNGNLVSNLLDSRETEYRLIAERNPDQRVFLNGWLNRVNALRGFVNSINSCENGSCRGFSYIPGIGLVTPTIKDLFTTAESIIPPPPRRDPLILNLDGDGVETTNVTDGAYFDHDGNGFAEQTGWASSDDGLLVLDRNSDGIINNGRELFGDQTILANGQKAANGFQALAELDTNHDNKIDANDAAYSQLRVWQDADGDGYSTADELWSLSNLGIVSISTASSIANATDPQGNIQTRVGTFTKADGSTSTIANLSLKTDATYTVANEWLDVPSDIAALPDLLGYENDERDGSLTMMK